MLTADMLSLLALLGAVSALDPFLTFHYVKYPRVFRRNEAACQICYGEFDCLSTECGYNAAAAEVLQQDDAMNIVKEALTSKVDSMMYDLLLEDSMKEYSECIPLISSYSTCNKDNICLGCTTCECSEIGRWNCTDTHKCSNTLLNVDHQVLSSVVEQLKSASRYKRSYEVLEGTSTRNFFEEIADWMYAKPVNTVKYNEHSTTIGVSRNMKPARAQQYQAQAQVPTTKSLRSFSDETILAFDDILSNDNLDQWIKSAEKDANKNKHENTDSRQFLQILRNIEEGEDDTIRIDNPAINIQLLKDIKKYLKDNSNGNESGNPSNDQPNSINAIITDTDDFDIEKQPSYMNSVATIVKRNAKDINETAIKNETLIRKDTATLKKETLERFQHKISNSSDPYPEREVQHLVDVVNVLINNERKDINHLNYVKDNLRKFSRKYKDYPNPNYVEHENHNIFDDYSSKHGKWEVDMRNFYMNNLKKDVKDTIRDIYAIQKLKNQGVAMGCFKKLKPLLFALTSYYLNNSRHQYTLKYSNISSPSTLINSSENQTTDSELRPQRRLFESSKHFYKIKLIKRALTRILLMIDNDTPSEYILSPLKPRTKNILNRIVVKLHQPQVHPSIRDPNFNLSEILTSLAEDWQHVPVDVHKLNPVDRLHSLKLLHLTLSQGIDKLKNAIISVQFGYSRRMSFIEEHVGKDLIAGAFKYLSNIDNRIKSFVFNADTSKVTPKGKNKEKDSMWLHIKNAFSNSKTGLMKYIQNKFHKPKSFIVNDMVGKRLEEVNRQKFLEVMKRWQENFDSYRGRQKRAVKHYAKRMKNIIPKYLREIKPNNKLNLPLYGNVIKHYGTGKKGVHTDKNKYSKAMTNKVPSGMNNYSETRKDKVHANGNKNVRIKKEKVDPKKNNYSEIKKDHMVHTKGNVNKDKSGVKLEIKVNPAKNSLVKLVNKVNPAKSRLVKLENKVNPEKNSLLKLENKVNPALHVYRSKGYNKMVIGAKLGNKIGYSTSTSKRGVRTRGYH